MGQVSRKAMGFNQKTDELLERVMREYCDSAILERRFGISIDFRSHYITHTI